jgi:hypothetical protein
MGRNVKMFSLGQLGGADVICQIQLLEFTWDDSVAAIPSFWASGQTKGTK